jgi:hypothetical protein
VQTQQLIEASAEIITITRLKAGDVYKRLFDGGYGTNRLTELRYGVVTEVLNNGEDGAIVAIEMNPGYNAVTVEQKVYESGANVALFAATPEEIYAHQNEIEKAAIAKQVAAQKALDEATATVQQVTRLLRKIDDRSLSIPETVRGEAAKQLLAGDVENEIDIVDRSAGLDD